MWRARQRDRLPDELRQARVRRNGRRAGSNAQSEVPFEAGSGPSQIERHQRQTLYQLMDGLNTFYQQSLQQPVAMSARQYLEKRGLSHEVIARFAIGFAPPAGTTS